MTLVMSREEYQGVLAFLLALPFGRGDRDGIARLAQWHGAVGDTVESPSQLRARVSINATKSYLDEKEKSRTAATETGQGNKSPLQYIMKGV